MQKPRKHRRWFWLFWLLAPLLLGWALRQVPFEQIGAVLARLTVTQILWLAFANSIIILLSSLRWWIILHSFAVQIPIQDLMAYRLAGFSVSYLTPGPQLGGEPLQVYLLRKQHDAGSAPAVASVYLDKLVELVSNFVFILAGAGTAAASGMFVGLRVGWLAVLLPVLAALPISHMAALRTGKQPLAALASRLQKATHASVLVSWSQDLSQAETQIGEFVGSRPGRFGLVLFVSALVWMASLAEFAMMLTFLGAPAGLVRTAGMMTAARIAFLAPLPGGFGALEGSLLIAASAAGLPAALALAASLVIRARDLALALFGLWLGSWYARFHPVQVERRS